MLFSFFRRPITNARPERVIDPRLAAKYILSPYALPSTDNVRACATLDDRRAIKRQQLDFVTAGGVFARRQLSQLASVSGALLLDFDHVADLPALKRWAVCNLRPLLAFTSPSGDGLKVLVDISAQMIAERIPLDVPINSHTIRERAASVYKYWYVELVNLALAQMGEGCGADKSASDISRATYLPCDFNCYINPALLA